MAGQPFFGQQAVGIELDKRKTLSPPHFDDLRQIVPNRGLAAGQTRHCRLSTLVRPKMKTPHFPPIDNTSFILYAL